MVAINRLSQKTGLYPTCYSLNNVEVDGKDPIAGGSFGDIFKGRLGTQCVCLKVVRLFQNSQVLELLKVRCDFPTMIFISGPHSMVKAFSREAVVWGQLSHPNLLPFYGIFNLTDTRSRICLVSPWMVNGNVNDFLRRNPDADRQQLVSSLPQLQPHSNSFISLQRSRMWPTASHTYTERTSFTLISKA